MPLTMLIVGRLCMRFGFTVAIFLLWKTWSPEEFGVLSSHLGIWRISALFFSSGLDLACARYLSRGPRVKKQILKLLHSYTQAFHWLLLFGLGVAWLGDVLAGYLAFATLSLQGLQYGLLTVARLQQKSRIDVFASALFGLVFFLAGLLGAYVCQNLVFFLGVVSFFLGLGNLLLLRALRGEAFGEESEIRRVLRVGFCGMTFLSGCAGVALTLGVSFCFLVLRLKGMILESGELGIALAIASPMIFFGSYLIRILLTWAARIREEALVSFRFLSQRVLALAVSLSALSALVAVFVALQTDEVFLVSGGATIAGFVAAVPLAILSEFFLTIVLLASARSNRVATCVCFAAVLLGAGPAAVLVVELGARGAVFAFVLEKVLVVMGVLVLAHRKRTTL